VARGVFVTGETKEDAEQQFALLGRSGASCARAPSASLGYRLCARRARLTTPGSSSSSTKTRPRRQSFLSTRTLKPEGERSYRELYLNLATDPDALVTGVQEAFDCPACTTRIEVKLPPPREVRFENHTTCPACEVFLVRPKDELPWRVAGRGTGPTAECAFCDEPGDSDEHVIPKWLSKRLSIKAEIPADVAFGVPAPRRRKQGISFGGYEAPVMCEGCNEHFGKLEEAVIPLVESMAKGVTVVLDEQSQQLLALWATKTAIALLAAEDPATVPKVHGRMVRDEARVPEGVWVGFFPWRGDPVLWTSTGSNANTTRRLVEMYGALLAFGSFGRRVTG
jgi:hypothetical protein